MDAVKPLRYQGKWIISDGIRMDPNHAVITGELNPPLTRKQIKQVLTVGGEFVPYESLTNKFAELKFFDTEEDAQAYIDRGMQS